MAEKKHSPVETKQPPVETMKTAVKKAIENANRTNDSRAAIRSLRATYNDLTQDMTDKIMVRKLRGMYNDAVTVIELPQSKLTGITPKKTQSDTTPANAETNQRMTAFASNLVSYVLHPNPATFYGASSTYDMPMPAWAQQLSTDYTDLISSYGGRTPQFIKALTNQLGNLPEEQKNMILGMFADETAFSNSLRTITRTQRAIDGISLVIKNKWLGGNASEAEIKRFFQTDKMKQSGLTDKDIQDIIALKDGSKTINGLFDKIAGGDEQNRRMMAFVIEANYGENAASLKPVINYMRKDSDPQFADAAGSSITNLELFYQTLLNPAEPGAKGIVARNFQDTWQRLRSAGDLTNRLLNGRTAVTSDNMLVKGTYDISVLVGFVRAYNESEYFKSGAFQGKISTKNSDGTTSVTYVPSTYLDAITGAGGYAPEVPLTILNNTATTDFIYKKFKKKPENIVKINGEMASNIAIIYSEPMGATFSPVYGTTAPATRQEAAEWLVATVPTLKGNKLIEDMREKWLDLGYSEDDPYIKLRTLYEIAMIGGVYADSDDLRRFLNELNVRATAWNNPQDAYNAIVEYVNNNPSMLMGMVDYYYAQLAESPETLISGMGNLVEQVRSKDVYSRINQIAANGTGTGESNVYANNEWTKDLLDFDATAGTSTGSAAGGFTYDASRNIVGGQTMEDRVKYEAYLQTQNLYMGQTRIYEMFTHWLDDKIASGDATLQQITDTKELDGKLRAGGFGGNLYVSFEQSSTGTSENGEKLTGSDRLHVEAIYSRNGQYFKVLVHDKSEGGKNSEWSSDCNINGELRDYGGQVSAHQYVAEHSQWALPFGSLAIGEVKQTPNYAKLDLIFDGVDADKLQTSFSSSGITLSEGNMKTITALGTGARINIQEGSKVYEVRKNLEGKYSAYLATPSQDNTNFGFVLGAQTGSETLAGLCAKTVDGGKFGMATRQFNKGKKDAPADKIGVVVSAGYIEYGQNQTDMYGKQRAYNQNQGPLGSGTPNGGMGIASLLTDKMYAMVMGGEQYGVGKVEADAGRAGSFGMGGMINWGQGGTDPKVYMFNGAHSIKDVISTRVVVDGLVDGHCRMAGQSSIDLGNGYKLHLYGSSRYANGAQDLTTENQKTIIDGMHMISESIASLENSTDANKGQQVHDLGVQMLDLLDKFHLLRPGDAFNNTTNQISVGLEMPDGTFSKLSLAKVNTETAGATGTKEMLYAVNMTSVRIGDGKAVSFTVGVPTTKTSGKDIRNFGGVKLDLGNVAFGVTEYDADFKNVGAGSTRFDIAWVNPKYDAKLKGAGAGVTYMKGGVTGDVTVGFNLTDKISASFTCTRTHMDGKSGKPSEEAYSIAETIAIGTARGTTWLITGGYQNAHEGLMKANELEIGGTAVSRTGWTASLTVGRKKFVLNDAWSREYTVNASARFNVF